MRYLLLVAAMLAGRCLHAQELFVYTEPASNMPAGSIGLRASNWVMREDATGLTNYHLIPELMWGINKHIMVHAEAFVSNRSRDLKAEGGALYAKWRFLSRDGVNTHFRMAAFGRVATNNADIHQQEIETNGHNTGFEVGVIGTQLLHRLALSAAASSENIIDNACGNFVPAGQARNAVNYSFSAGRLILPRTYTGYGQTNLNVMVECLGQYHPATGNSFFDATASVQFIFNSQTRVDVAYKHALYSNMLRTAPNGFLLRIEHLLFNVTR